MFDAEGTFVQVVRDGHVARRNIETGLICDGLVEVRQGLAAGDIVVAKAGTFLRDGDAVRAVTRRRCEPLARFADLIELANGSDTDAPQRLRLVDPQAGPVDRAVRRADAARP